MNWLLYVMLGGLALLFLSVVGMVVGTAAWIYRARQKRKARAFSNYVAAASVLPAAKSPRKRPRRKSLK